MVPKPQNPIPLPRQPRIAPRIPRIPVVLPTIGLDDQAMPQGREINDVGADGELAAELEAGETVGAEVVPEAVLGLGHGGAEVFCEAALVHFPSPQPLSPRGEGL